MHDTFIIVFVKPSFTIATRPKRIAARTENRPRKWKFIAVILISLALIIFIYTYSLLLKELIVLLIILLYIAIVDLDRK